jgi:ATP-dependent Clp protease protease subunit
MNRKLLSLARDNSGKGTGIRSEVAGDTATIYVYDIIDGMWGVGAADLAAQLSGITAPNIVLRINCPGGDVFEGRAMMTCSSSTPPITAKIDGIAASAASVLVLAAESVEIAEGGFFMIHKGWTFMMGNADDLRVTAGLLDKVDGTMITDYAAKSGKDPAEIEAWMKAETWFDARRRSRPASPTPSCRAPPRAPRPRPRPSTSPSTRRRRRRSPNRSRTTARRKRMLARLGLYDRTAAA